MSRRILVADDSSTIQKVIKIAFSRFSVEIAEAASYIEALAVVARGVPDVLIIDASLPGANGPADFARLSGQSGDVPVLLLVGTYEAVDEAQFRSMGFANFLRKPFDSGDLVNLVDKLISGGLGGKSETPAPPLTAPPPPPPPRSGPGESIPSGATTRPAHATVFQTGGHLHIPDSPPGQTMPPPPPPSGGQRPLSAPPRSVPHIDAPFGDDDSPTSEHALSDAEGRELSRFAIDDDDSGLNVPPPPATDYARKGRRAFSHDELAAQRREAASERPQLKTETPGIAGLGMPPPPPLFTGDGELSASRRSSPPRSLYDEADELEESSSDPLRSPLLTPPTSRQAPSSRTPPPPSLDHLMGELMARLESELPALVREAVESYCESHFKSLAREVITAELRRLADEKARHLVDN